MVEKGLHGSISYIANRYLKPNNKYLNDCDKNKESSYLMYLDVNKLYDWAMSRNCQLVGLNGSKVINGTLYLKGKKVLGITL